MADEPREARFARALRHPVRARIFRLISDREASSVEIAKALGLPVSNISYHVRALASAGLIEPSRTSRRRGAIETHFRASRTRSGERQVARHLTPEQRRIAIGPVVEAAIEGVGGQGPGLLDDVDGVFFFEAVEWTGDTVVKAAGQLVAWSARLRLLEAESWRRRRQELRWFAACGWLSLAHPPPGAARLSLSHRRGDELEIRTALALPHARAVLPDEAPPLSPIAQLADAPELDLLLHPLRMRIFRLLKDPASSKELSDALGESVANVSYHVQSLVNGALLNQVTTKRRRGAVETFYRARYAMEINEPDWLSFSEQQRRRFIRMSVDESMNSLRATIGKGGFDEPKRSVLFRLAVRLDQQAAHEAAEDLMELHLALARTPPVDASSQPHEPVTLGGAMFHAEPMPGRPIESRRHGPDAAALPGDVQESDPTSEANPRPIGSASSGG